VGCVWVYMEKVELRSVGGDNTENTENVIQKM